MAADKIELRGLCPADLAQALDALAHADGMDRNTYVVSVLDREVRRVAHEAIVLHRTLRGNTYLAEPEGGVHEASR